MRTNYSFAERLLHKFALGSRILQNQLFELEKYLFLDTKNQSRNLTKGVFITGLARSGTTSLLNLLFENNKFASLKYHDMPFITAPNTWKKIREVTSTKVKEDLVVRAHDDGIKISTNSPESFDEIFWLNLLSKNYIKKDLLMPHDLSNEQLNEFNKFTQLVTIKENKEFYLSKNNNNVLRLTSLSKFFNESLFLVMFRDPLNQANSLMKQHKLFNKIQSNNSFVLDYMNLIGHFEFGINKKIIFLNYSSKYVENQIEYWLEYWVKLYENLILKKEKNIEFICYEDLCNNANTYLKEKLKNYEVFKFNYNYETLQNKNIPLNISDKSLLENAYTIYNKLKDF